MPIRKSFFADTVESALALATRRMGADTLLIGSRHTEPSERHLGLYEVIVEGETQVSCDDIALSTSATENGAGRPFRTPRTAGSDESELDVIRREISSLRSLLLRYASRMVPVLPPELLPISDFLNAADFSPTLVESLLHSTTLRLSGENPGPGQAELSRAMLRDISSRLRVDPGIGRPDSARKVIAFAGPAGSGKTSTLVKLAARLGLGRRTPTLVISTDNYRVAAGDQLRAYAAILGMNCEVVETPGGLLRSLEANRSKETALVDLAGMGPREPELIREWAPVLSRPEIDVHLVVPATMRYADLTRTAARFEPLRPSHLVFTHLDETACYGAVLSLAIESGRPVSFLCAGQSIPEDIEPATRSGLLRLIGGEQLAAMAA